MYKCTSTLSWCGTLYSNFVCRVGGLPPAVESVPFPARIAALGASAVV